MSGCASCISFVTGKRDKGIANEQAALASPRCHIVRQEGMRSLKVPSVMRIPAFSLAVLTTIQFCARVASLSLNEHDSSESFRSFVQFWKSNPVPFQVSQSVCDVISAPLTALLISHQPQCNFCPPTRRFGTGCSIVQRLGTMLHTWWGVKTVRSTLPGTCVFVTKNVIAQQ